MRSGTLRHRATALLTGSVLAAGLGVAGTFAAAPAASAADRPSPVMFGTAVGTEKELLDYEKLVGRKIVAYRIYRNWDDKLFSPWELTARNTGHIPFTSIKAKTNKGAYIKYTDIANAKPGSATYKTIAAHAQEAKSYRSMIYLAFNHEPDAVEAKPSGTPAEYQAAYRKIKQIFRAEGANNVRFAMTLTAWGYVKENGAVAKAYYPGDDIIDVIAGDGYNWGNCKDAKGKWMGFATVFDGLRKFGAAHPSKSVQIWELGSVEGTTGAKARWWTDSRQVLRLPAWEQFDVALTWNGRNMEEPHGCNFDFASSSSSQKAWVGMRHDMFLSTWRVHTAS